MTQRWKFDAEGLPLLDQFSDDGFVDCVLRMIELRRSRTHYSMTLGAGRDGKTLGISVTLPRRIQAGLSADVEVIRENVLRDAIVFERTGAESDRLLTTLARLYGRRPPSTRLAASVTFTGIALHQGEIDVEREPVKLKLFGHDKPDDDPKLYNETFFNMDLPNRLVFWNEKDPEYRRPLLSALSNRSRPKRRATGR
jgi:hypothetical protein